MSATEEGETGNIIRIYELTNPVFFLGWKFFNIIV